MTLQEFFEAEYERLYRWREQWTRLASTLHRSERGRLQSRQEAIERRAAIANNRIGALLKERWGERPNFR